MRRRDCRRRLDTVFRARSSRNCFGCIPTIAHYRIIKRLKHSFDESMEFVFANFLRCCILPQLGSWFLPSGPGFKWGFLQEQLFQIICRIEIRLIARWAEHWGHFLSLQGSKIDIGKELVRHEALKADRANSPTPIFFHQRGHGSQARDGDRGVRDIVFRLRLFDVFAKSILRAAFKRSLSLH